MAWWTPRNPMVKTLTHDPERPAPGGIDGQRVDWERWYPPDTPFGWGQAFPTPFSNVPAINGGRWINQFLPDKEFEVPAFVSSLGYLFPVAGGTSGAFQAQLVAGSPRPPTNQATVQALNAYGQALQAQQPAGLEALAGGFARS